VASLSDFAFFRLIAVGGAELALVHGPAAIVLLIRNEPALRTGDDPADGGISGRLQRIKRQTGGDGVAARLFDLPSPC
jgi:hypothetical protein